MDWYLGVLKKYADFNGRARRKEYWMFFLFNMIFAIVAMVLDNILGVTFGETGIGPIYLLYFLAILLPSLALVVRRLHDTGKSGWFILLGFIPLVGGIIILVFMLIEGNAGPNQYGPDPKGATASASQIS